MRQADIIAITLGALFVVWLIRTGRVKRIAGTSSDPIMQAFERTGSTGAFPVPTVPFPLTTEQGKAIAERARQSLGAPTGTFNAQYPRRACASYVSSVLVSLGLLDAKDPRCSGLAGKLSGSGATKIGSGPAGTTPTQVGDIIFYRDSTGQIKHVEIAGGGGSSIGASSSQQKIGERPIGSRGFPTIDIWRYAR